MSQPAVPRQRLAKSFRLGPRLSYHRFSEFLENTIRSAIRLPGRLLKSESTDAAAPDVLWAVDDISFEVPPGEVRRDHRPQRRRQKHAAQNPVAHHRAHRRPRSSSAAASAACWKSAPAFIPS